MSLTKGSGPFSGSPAGTFNFELPSGDGHLLYFEPSPRRVRAELAGVTVADSSAVMLLHETGLTPVYYFPERDVRSEHLRPTEHHTRCPFKGEARYYSVVVGDRVEENVAWTYPEPLEKTPPIAGYIAFYWQRMDRWLEEDEVVLGYPRDPYHRIDVLRSSRHVVVRVGSQIVAETRAPRILFEASLPARYYIRPEDVRSELLADTETHTWCPYKGKASYKSVEVGGTTVKDAAWYYPEPFHDALDVGGWLCFYDDKDDVTIEVS